MMDPIRVTKDDPRYEYLSGRGDNARFPPRPESFVLARTSAEVVAAVQAAVDAGRPIAARSGGHCYEDFVADERVLDVIDLTCMNAISWDVERGAVAVEPGARLHELSTALYLRWGVTLPSGASRVVAAGGHIVGGGYGPLSRRFGLSADHLHAVEVVVVDADGRARAVVATRDPTDPVHDLWWGLTGGGGGNFGIVTRYWMRSPDARGDEPGRALPRPPRTMLAASRMFPRGGMTRDAFRALVGGYGRWHERNSAPGSPYAGLFSGLVLFARGSLDAPELSAILLVQMDGDEPDARALLASCLAEITAGTGSAVAFDGPVAEEPWLASMGRLAAAQDGEGGRHKIKSAYLRRAYTDDQIDTLFTHIDSAEHRPERASVSLQSTGCAVNAVAPGATAVPQRDSVLRALYLATWQDPADDAACLGWMRALYHGVYADTGGVPVPGDRHDGCYINFPDIDVADPAWNTSGVPWQHLYFKDDYRRLQTVAAAWDPLGVFGHALSIRPRTR